MVMSLELQKRGKCVYHPSKISTFFEDVSAPLDKLKVFSTQKIVFQTMGREAILSRSRNNFMNLLMTKLALL